MIRDTFPSTPFVKLSYGDAETALKDRGNILGERE